MWARTSMNYVKTQGLRLGATSASSVVHTIGICDHYVADGKSPTDVCLREKKFYNTVLLPRTLSLVARHISSYAGAEGVGEEGSELDKGFSKLDNMEASDLNENRHMQDDVSEIFSELNLPDEDDVGCSTSGSELKLETERRFCSGQSSQKKWKSFDLLGILLNEPKSVHTALDNYLSDGKFLENSDISYAMLTLLNNQMHTRALQFSEYLEAKNLLVFNEQHYASRINLIAKVQGLKKAELYFESIPKSSKGGAVYSAMLTNCISSNNLKKAEKLFNEMKQSRFGISSYACNQMILIYQKWFSTKKITDVLLYMEKENLKRTLLTYKLLIDAKDVSGDIPGIVDIVEMMKTEGIEPDFRTRLSMAKHYVAIGLTEEALSVIDGCNLKYTNPLPWATIVAIPVFASLGMADEVERIWKVCEQEPLCNGWVAVIRAWGKLQQVDKAEAVFEKLAKKTKLSKLHYSAMFRVYASNKMFNKAKDLLGRMGETAIRKGQSISDGLVRFYVEAGEVEEADALLEKAARGHDDLRKPMYCSYICVMERYAERGDVHNSERILHMLRRAGYTYRTRTHSFQLLLESYINSNTPTYGFRERMSVDKLIPNQAMEVLLSQTDPFKNTAAPKSLD